MYETDRKDSPEANYSPVDPLAAAFSGSRRLLQHKRLCHVPGRSERKNARRPGKRNTRQRRLHGLLRSAAILYKSLYIRRRPPVQHCGIDPIAIGRAAWTDIKAMAFVEGGSTITQQLAKNLLFTQEKKIERKTAEIFAALALETNYSKNEIFELYANTSYFGGGYYGIHDASMGYFGKEPSELTDYECAMLAGIPKAPSVYSPNNSEELAAKRANQVLECMVKNKVISQKDVLRITTEIPAKPRRLCRQPPSGARAIE